MRHFGELTDDLGYRIDLSRVREWQPGQCEHVWSVGYLTMGDGTRCRLDVGHEGQHKPMMPAHVDLLAATEDSE